MPVIRDVRHNTMAAAKEIILTLSNAEDFPSVRRLLNEGKVVADFLVTAGYIKNFRHKERELSSKRSLCYR